MTLLEDSENPKGCVLIPLWGNDAEKIIAWSQKHIPDDVLAADGYERTPHVTVLYGFDARLDPSYVIDALEKYPDNVSFTLGKISRFESEAYDVIKVDVEGRSLHLLNSYLVDSFEEALEQTYPEYRPHLTLAYVKKGACPELDGDNTFANSLFVFDQVVYSGADKTKLIGFLGKEED